MSKFRAMRRHRQQLSQEESISILERATSGTLALLGDDDYPYAVPISFVYHEAKMIGLDFCSRREKYDNEDNLDDGSQNENPFLEHRLAILLWFQI